MRSSDEMSMRLKAKISTVSSESGLQYACLQPKHVWQVVNELVKDGRTFHQYEDFGAETEVGDFESKQDQMDCSED